MRVLYVLDRQTEKKSGQTLLAASQTIDIEYDGFNIIVDCQKRGAVRFEYFLSGDTGSLPRKHNFTFDDDIEDTCQQSSTKSYGSRYDRGHLVPANHLDHLEVGIEEKMCECVCDGDGKARK